ncbi:MarR family winged helix-turn-helix transcriptional regulator [Knoellia sp. CPCC 206450]|uniref:MarR family winged helix-turn-helix transcriptional regulator n=1 Tax=Knoellia tibetensis TaxID=3404798 RepID=UPI003B437EDD
MVKQSSADEFELFASSLFRLTRSLRAASHLWLQLPGGLSPTDVTLLKVLEDHGDARSGFIAERLHVGPSVISRQLVTLTAEGLVERRRDPADGRAELVSLSEEGRARLASLRRAYVERMREHFTDWDGETATGAARTLDEITDHIIPALGGSSPAARTRATTARPDTSGTSHDDTDSRTDTQGPA